MRKILTLWLLYFALALILTWPTVTHFTTYLPGDGGDDPAIAWNLWWLKYSLLNLGQNPFHSQAMFYPIGINLAFYTLTLLNGLLALPLTLNFGAVTASNLHLWFTFVVGGYGMYLLCHYVLIKNLPHPDPLPLGEGEYFPALPRPLGEGWSEGIATLSGLFYAFASSKLFYVALGQFNIASNHWLPFAVLYLLRTRHQPHHLSNSAMLGLFLTLQAWSELTYASFLLIFITLYYTWEIITNWRKPLISNFSFLISHFSAFIIMGLISLIGLSPILAAMLPDMRAEGDFFVEGSGFAQDFSADLLGFIIPTMHHPLFGQLIQQTNIHAYDKGQHIYLGFILITFTLLALLQTLRQSNDMGFWFMAAFIFAWLTLGPHLTFNGHETSLNGPFVIFQHLPFFKGNRYPSRYTVMLILCLSITAPVGIAYFHQWLKPKLTPYSLLLITFLFIAEHLSAPLPQSDMTIPSAYQMIAQNPHPATVLDIPFAWRNGFDIIGALTTQFMFGQFYQTLHQKELLQGNTSRNPSLKFQYFVRAPIINSLLALETGHTLPPSRLTQDEAIANEVLQFFNIRYIAVRPYHYDRFDGRATQTVSQANILPYLENLFPLQIIAASPAMTLYQVNLASPQTNTLHLDSNNLLMPLYLGEGWGLITPGQPLVAQRDRVRLLIPFPPRHLTVMLADGPNGYMRTVYMELNGWTSSHQPPNEPTYSFEPPATALHEGMNEVILHFSDNSPTNKPLTRSIIQDITVQSAGEEVGGFGQIFINGHDISLNQRGFNVAIIQTDTFTVANFDTHLDPNASAALANFLHQAPPEATIALAVADEASLNLSEVAIHALQQRGAKLDLQGCFRCSYALIYRPNQPTLEALNPLQPVGLTTHYGLTEPQITALIDWLEIGSEK